MRQILTLLMALLVCGAAHAQKDYKQTYKEGKALYDAKKYKAALPKLKEAADGGYKKAQYRLGRAYDKGNGVKEDNTTAVIRKDAKQGDDDAKAMMKLLGLKSK